MFPKYKKVMSWSINCMHKTFANIAANLYTISLNGTSYFRQWAASDSLFTNLCECSSILWLVLLSSFETKNIELSSNIVQIWHVTSYLGPKILRQGDSRL